MRMLSFFFVVIMSTGGEKSKPASQPDGKAAQTQKKTEMGMGNYKVAHLQMNKVTDKHDGKSQLP